MRSAENAVGSTAARAAASEAPNAVASWKANERGCRTRTARRCEPPTATKRRDEKEERTLRPSEREEARPRRERDEEREEEEPDRVALREEAEAEEGSRDRALPRDVLLERAKAEDDPREAERHESRLDRRDARGRDERREEGDERAREVAGGLAPSAAHDPLDDERRDEAEHRRGKPHGPLLGAEDAHHPGEQPREEDRRARRVAHRRRGGREHLRPALEDVARSHGPAALVRGEKVGASEEDEPQQGARRERRGEEEAAGRFGIFGRTPGGHEPEYTDGAVKGPPRGSILCPRMSEPDGPPLTVTLIARDEEDRLPAALASVAFAEEIVVVVDAATTDRTAEIAEAAGARVLVRAFDGFGAQKNAAAALASNRWVLSIDADEIVSPALALEIRSRLATIASEKAPPAAFRIPIRLEFLGRALRFGRDTVVRPARLYDRSRARFSADPVHERVLANGPVESLDESVLHRSYRDLAHYLDKLDRYTTLAAEAKLAARRRAMPFLPVRVVWEFLDRAFLRLGVLDGTAGLTFAALSASNTLLKYLKLQELERAVARGERLPPAGAPTENTAALRLRALMRARR